MRRRRRSLGDKQQTAAAQNLEDDAEGRRNTRFSCRIVDDARRGVGTNLVEVAIDRTTSNGGANFAHRRSNNDDDDDRAGDLERLGRGELRARARVCARGSKLVFCIVDLQLVRNLETGAKRIATGSFERLVLFRRLNSVDATSDDAATRAASYGMAAYGADEMSPPHSNAYDEVLIISLPFFVWMLILLLISCSSCIVCRLLSCCIC